MEQFAVGEIVLVRFPFANFSRVKKRPALIVGQAEFDNLILCQITSSAMTSRRAVKISKRDFSSGQLPITSFVRPDKIITVEPAIIELKLGKLKQKSMVKIHDAIRQLFN